MSSTVAATVLATVLCTVIFFFFFFLTRDVRYASRVVHHCSRYSNLKKKSFGNTAFPQQRAGL